MSPLRSWEERIPECKRMGTTKNPRRVTVEKIVVVEDTYMLDQIMGLVWFEVILSLRPKIEIESIVTKSLTKFMVLKKKRKLVNDE